MGIELVGKRNGVRACANLADLVIYGRRGDDLGRGAGKLDDAVEFGGFINALGAEED